MHCGSCSRSRGKTWPSFPIPKSCANTSPSSVLDRYQQLGEKFPADPGVRLETAQVFRVIGGIGRITGQYAKSLESYENAIQGLTTLCENDPRQADYRRWLVEALNERGELNHMNGRTVDAEKDFRTAIRHAEKLPSLPSSPWTTAARRPRP